MTDTTPVSLVSAYTEDGPRPLVVKGWEKVVRSQPDTQAATMQLTYELLLQVRIIKMILMTVLVFVPLVVIGGVVALAMVLGPESETSKYGF